MTAGCGRRGGAIPAVFVNDGAVSSCRLRRTGAPGLAAVCTVPSRPSARRREGRRCRARFVRSRRRGHRVVADAMSRAGDRPRSVRRRSGLAAPRDRSVAVMAALRGDRRQSGTRRAAGGRRWAPGMMPYPVARGPTPTGAVNASTRSSCSGPGTPLAAEASCRAAQRPSRIASTAAAPTGLVAAGPNIATSTAPRSPSWPAPSTPSTRSAASTASRRSPAPQRAGPTEIRRRTRRPPRPHSRRQLPRARSTQRVRARPPRRWRDPGPRRPRRPRPKPTRPRRPARRQGRTPHPVGVPGHHPVREPYHTNDDRPTDRTTAPICPRASATTARLLYLDVSRSCCEVSRVDSEKCL